MKRFRNTSTIRHSRLEIPIADLLKLLDLPPPERDETLIDINVWSERKACADHRRPAVIIQVEYTEVIHASKEDLNAQSEG